MQIEASYGGGVLRLTIPVAEKAKPRRIKIASEDKQVQSTPNDGPTVSALGQGRSIPGRG